MLRLETSWSILHTSCWMVDDKMNGARCHIMVFASNNPSRVRLYCCRWLQPLKTTLTRFCRSVGIKTRKDKSLDQVYAKALGQSDHPRLFLTPHQQNKTIPQDSADTGSLWSLVSRTAGRSSLNTKTLSNALQQSCFTSTSTALPKSKRSPWPGALVQQHGAAQSLGYSAEIEKQGGAMIRL